MGLYPALFNCSPTRSGGAETTGGVNFVGGGTGSVFSRIMGNMLIRRKPRWECDVSGRSYSDMGARKLRLKYPGSQPAESAVNRIRLTPSSELESLRRMIRSKLSNESSMHD